MKIHLHNKQSEFEVPAPLVRKVVRHILKLKQITCDEVSLYFVTKEEISELHAEYFNDPTETDCITFPMDDPYETTDGPLVLGEVFICPYVAKQFSEKHQTSYIHELLLYVIHGLLHLLGFDDISPEDYTEMKEEEKACMRYLVECKVIEEHPYYIN